jgi:hypothetical protein
MTPQEEEEWNRQRWEEAQTPQGPDWQPAKGGDYSGYLGAEMQREGESPRKYDEYYTGQVNNPYRWGGVMGQAEGGYIVPGTSGADVDVARYRGLGEAAYGTAGPAIDRVRTREGRGLVLGSLGHIQAVADGRESESLRLGQEQARQAALAQQSMAASVRGGAAARAAASSAAGRGVARSNAQIANYARAGQAAEMAQARQQLMQGTTGLRGQDLGLASSQAELEAKQRSLNEQQQQAYERMGWETRNADMQAAAERRRQVQNQQLADRKAKAAEQAQQEKEVLDWTSFGLGTISRLSDARAKIPVGSLASLMR